MSILDYSTGSTGIDRQDLARVADLLADLPDPPETFLIHDVPPAERGTFKSLRETPVIQTITPEQRDDGDETTCDLGCNVYRVTPDTAADAAEIRAERHEWCPCGHSGFKNKGEYFVCGYEPCDRQFSRAELEVKS